MFNVFISSLRGLSPEAIQSTNISGLLRSARNDGYLRGLRVKPAMTAFKRVKPAMTGFLVVVRLMQTKSASRIGLRLRIVFAAVWVDIVTSRYF